MGLFVDQVLNGVAAGTIYASVALALVLIYRTTGLLNFAQGELGDIARYAGRSILRRAGSATT